MRGGRGFTFIETMIAAFMIMASLVVMTQLMMRPVEVVTTLSPKAEAQQISLHLAQDQVEQFRASSLTAPLTNPAPGPTPAGIQTGYAVTLYDETALAADATAGSPTIALNSCAHIRGPVGAQPGSKLQIDAVPNAEFADVLSIVAGSPCQVSLTANLAAAHSLGAPVVPAIPGATAPLVLDKTIFHQYLTVLVTAPLVGTRLFADAAQNAAQITVRDASPFKARDGATPGSFLRIDSDTQTETQVREVVAVAGNTLTLDLTLSQSHSLGAVVAAATRTSAAVAAGEKCITVDDITLFQKEIGVEINTGNNLENAIVKDTGSGSTCVSVTPGTNTVGLTRPLRKAHAASVPVVPAVFSASSFSVIGGGKQKLGI